MIRYALACDRGHDFESWFANSSAYDSQSARGLVACPVCGSQKVGKTIMAPKVAQPRKRSAQPAPEAAPKPGPEATSPAPLDVTNAPAPLMSPVEQEFRRKLKALREHLVSNSDYVGPRFPDEARQMHYGDIEHRSIYGEASPDEARALLEEGITFHPLPLLPDERN